MRVQDFIKKYTHKRQAYFQVADHLLALAYEEQIDLEKGLESFIPFAAPRPSDNEKLVAVFDICLQDAPSDGADAKLLSDVSMILDERFKFHETSDHYITSIDGVPGKAGPWKMLSDKDFKLSTIYCNQQELYSTFKCNWLIMVGFGQAVLAHDTILMHSSVIENDNKGYAFLGKSGTGKSTHSKLWLSHIQNTSLLNDDNPAVRVFPDGEVFIYGTPWSGKTHCYKQRKLALGGIVRLQQAPSNEFLWAKGADALVRLLPSGSAIRWNALLFNQMLSTLQLIVQTVPVGHLKCLPDKQAALLCYNELTSMK